jgi:hypothetical protein
LAGLTDLRVEPQVEFVLNRGPSDPPGFVHGVRTQIWGGMVWNASPVQRFAATEGVYTEQLRAELQARGLADVRLLSLPEVPEAGSIPEALAEIDAALRT